MDLFEVLAQRRKELGIKYEELSERSSVPVNTLKKIFTGNIAAPSFESIKMIAYAMGMTLEELDRKIEEKKDYSDEDLALLKSISALDAPGKAAVMAVLETQQQRIKEYGHLTRRYTVIQGTNEAELQMKYQAMREREELEAVVEIGRED